MGLKSKVKHKFLVVGPIDRLIRGGFGFIILIFTYTLDYTIIQFAGLHMIFCFFALTAMTGWDPAYYFIKQLWEGHKVRSAISGRFK